MPSFFNLTGCLTIDTLILQINPMPKKIILLLSLTLLLSVAAFVLWRMDKSSVPVVTPEPVPEEVSETPQASSEAESFAYQQYIEAIPGNTDEVWYNIPELGVRMKLNKEFAEDLIYKFSYEVDSEGSQWEAAYFSTKALTTIDNGCSPEEGSPLGVLTKSMGNVQQFAKTDVYFSSRLDSIVQIGGYYYMWTGPQATCWDPKNDDVVYKAKSAKDYVGSGAKYVSDGMKTLQSVP